MAEVSRQLQELSDRARAALIDAQAIADFGTVDVAELQLSFALGLSDGDSVPLDDDGEPILNTPLETIRQNLDKALALKAQGWSTQRIVVEGLS